MLSWFFGFSKIPIFENHLALLLAIYLSNRSRKSSKGVGLHFQKEILTHPKEILSIRPGPYSWAWLELTFDEQFSAWSWASLNHLRKSLRDSPRFCSRLRREATIFWVFFTYWGLLYKCLSDLVELLGWSGGEIVVPNTLPLCPRLSRRLDKWCHRSLLSGAWWLRNWQYDHKGYSFHHTSYISWGV